MTGLDGPGGIGTVAGTTPYPWPWDGGCTGGRLALVAVGWDAGWRHRVDGDAASAAEVAVAWLAAAVTAAGGTVLSTAHAPPPRSSPPDNMRRPVTDSVAPRRIDTPPPAGADNMRRPVTETVGPRRIDTSPSAGAIDVRVASGRIEPPGVVGGRGIEAAGIDAFHGSGLDAALRHAGATHLLIVGHGLEGPVHSTMRSANDQGYECLLVLDAASPLRPDLVPASRSMVEMSGGIFGAVGLTADVLAALVPTGTGTGTGMPTTSPVTTIPRSTP